MLDGGRSFGGTPQAEGANVPARSLQAAVDTAACLASPTGEWARRKEVFDACALYRATPDHAKIRGLQTKLKVPPQ